MTSPENLRPSASYAADIKILDAEPWNADGPIDRLIFLQQQAFAADRSRNHNRFGTIVMEMSGIEHEIGNHSEAAAYAEEAIGAFSQGGDTQSLIAAQSTAAKEYRLLESPDLVLSAVSSVLTNRTRLSQAQNKFAKPVLDGGMHPVLRLANSFAFSYTGGTAEDTEYPAYRLRRKSPRPSADAAVGLAATLEQLLDVSVLMQSNEADNTLLWLQMLYIQLAHRKFGLPRSERREAKHTSEQIRNVRQYVTFSGSDRGSPITEVGLPLRELFERSKNGPPVLVG
ncbi:MAG TPA: hypothetical protein VF401_03890 [Candidatus Saccharimonadales bacterium]